MPDVLFDEWQLQWRLDVTLRVDATTLHARLNAPETVQAVQDCLQQFVQHHPDLRPLQVQLDR